MSFLDTGIVATFTTSPCTPWERLGIAGSRTRCLCLATSTKFVCQLTLQLLHSSFHSSSLFVSFQLHSCLSPSEEHAATIWTADSVDVLHLWIVHPSSLILFCFGAPHWEALRGWTVCFEKIVNPTDSPKSWLQALLQAHTSLSAWL